MFLNVLYLKTTVSRRWKMNKQDLGILTSINLYKWSELAILLIFLELNGGKTINEMHNLHMLKFRSAISIIAKLKDNFKKEVKL